MAINQTVTNYIADIFTQFTDGVIPETVKPLIEQTYGLISENGGPVLTLAEVEGGYLPSFEGNVYDDSMQSALISDINASSEQSENVKYGTLSSSELGEPYSAAHLAGLLATITKIPGENGNGYVQIPGCNARLIIKESDGENPPELYFSLGEYVLYVIPPREVVEDAGRSLNGQIYLNYQIIKSQGYDVIFKCYLSDTSLGDGDYQELFEGKSINHYNTSMQHWNDEKPVVHPDLSLDGGFALLQYDTVQSSEIEMVGYYNYGVLFMNTNAAPLIFMADNTSSTERTRTTSLHSLGDEPWNMNNEILWAPMSSDDYDLSSMAIAAPIITPASNDKMAVYSRWLCLGNTVAYSSVVYSLSAGWLTFYCDHGLCLSGGVDI